MNEGEAVFVFSRESGTKNLQYDGIRRTRTRTDMDAFEKICNLKKNETVETCKVFSRLQNPCESIEKLVTDFKLLATACNFADLKDSLVTDRIICRIQDKQPCDDLLKDPCLDLQQSLDACRANKLSKE